MILTKPLEPAVTTPVQPPIGSPPSNQLPTAEHSAPAPDSQSADSYLRPFSLWPGSMNGCDSSNGEKDYGRRRGEAGLEETDKDQAAEISRGASMAARFRSLHQKKSRCPGTFSQSVKTCERANHWGWPALSVRRLRKAICWTRGRLEEGKGKKVKFEARKIPL
jgi:hypothetical protein